MGKQTILIIRHAEKPNPGVAEGVDSTGQPDGKSLTPRGWQRAGAWVQLFAPPSGQNALLPMPDALFASAPETHHDIAANDGGSKSRRPFETVSPLAAKLNIDVDLSFAKDSEQALAQAISAIDGVVLVCWQHENIRDITNALTPSLPKPPTEWPKERFNVLFRFDRAEHSDPWTFQQVVPVMLDGDEPHEIAP
jgi:broad specificity phosphatase PhoE